MIVKIMRMERCSWCGGFGLCMNGENVSDCRECGGGGMVEARDAKGRFVPWERIEVPDEEAS